MSRVATWLDDFISVFSPSWAAKRITTRLAYEKMRKYYGAQLTKTDKYWNPTGGDADSEILPDLPRLRARSRDLTRNNCWGLDVVNTLVTNVVGVGIKPQVRGNATGQQVEEYLKKRFAEPEDIDLTGEQDFYELQALALRQFLECGEAFAKIIFDGGKRPRLVKLQFIEPDQIYSYRTTTQSGNQVREGIEIDSRTGKHLSYYLNRHPGAYASTTYNDFKEERILRQDMIHIFCRTRPGQTRGVPLLTAVIQQLHDLGEYVEAELVAARVAACLAVFIKRDHHAAPQEDVDGDKVQSLHPGMIARLGKGEDIACVEPKRPGDEFDRFTSFQVRSVGAGTGLSYESISKDYSKVNYSSGRMGKLEERANYRVIQQFLIKKFCRRVEREIQTLRILRGDQRERLKVLWLPPGFEWVDPEKEAKAQVYAIENNIKTKSQIIAESGGDIDEVFAQRQKEKELEKEMGIERTEPGLSNPSALSAKEPE